MMIAALLLTLIGSAQAATTVSGVVTTNAKAPAPIRVTIDQKVCGSDVPDESLVVDSQGHVANAVITLVGVKRASSLEPVVTNEKCRFIPHVQIARPNANVRTTSKDPMLHTTQAQHDNGGAIFNVALPMPGINMTKPIGAAGIARLSCNIHPWMRGWVIVTDDAAAVSGADGRFSIDNVPPGTYELRVWHETLKSVSQKITVVAGKPAQVNLSLTAK